MRRYILVHVDMNQVGVFVHMHNFIIIMPGLNAHGLQSKLLITTT